MGAIAPGAATIPLDNFGFSPSTIVDAPESVVVEDNKAPTDVELPRLRLPDPLLDEIGIWIREQIDYANSERQEVEERWKVIQRMYEEVELEDDGFPFEDSARLVIPIIATFTETVWSKIVNTIFTPSDPFSTKQLRTDFVETAKALRKWLTYASNEELNLEEVCSSLFLELVKLGTCVAKIVYTREERMMFVYDPKDRKYTKTPVMTKNHPEIVHIPLADYFFRQGYKSKKDLPWQSHRYKLTWGQVLQRGEDGRFDKDLVEKFLVSYKAKKADNEKSKLPGGTPATRTPYEEERDKISGESPLSNDEFEFHEIWFEYIVPGEDKLPIRLVAWYETGLGLIMNIKHNFMPLQDDPFEICTYIPREHRIYGFGVGYMAMPFQNEITAMHNQRLDNATVANANVTFIKDDANVPLNFRVKPGGTYGIENPELVKSLPLGQKYDSTINEEQHTLSMIQHRIGIEYMQNQQQGEHTSTQFIINMQEATRKFDIVVRGVRRFMYRIIEKALLLYQMHYPDGKIEMIMGPDGKYVEDLFKLPPRMIKDGIAIRVTATTSATAKELERQTKLSLFNMMTQYYGQLTQYVGQASNPQIPPVVQQTMLAIVEALGILVGNILEDFEEPDRARLVIDEESVRTAAIDRAGVGPSGVPGGGIPANGGSTGATPAGNGGPTPAQINALQQRMATVQQLFGQQIG